MRTILSLCAVVFLACGGTQPGNELFDDELGDGADELSAYSRSYVTLRRDTRRCMWPLCGGYFVRDVNRTWSTERYVNGLDFSLADLSDPDQRAVLDAGDGEVVLRAKLGALDKLGKNTRPLQVSEAYRGMPGVRVAEGETYYWAEPRNPTIYCITAPCPNETAHKLNSTKVIQFSGYRVNRAAKFLVDQDWLTSRVAEHHAVVAAKFVDGQKFPGGYEQLLDASQVFVRLPETPGPCPLGLFRCEDGTVETFSRSADRCLVQTRCVKPGVCARYMPQCDEGYSLVSWHAEPHGCPKFACDPTFVAQ